MKKVPARIVDHNGIVIAKVNVKYNSDLTSYDRFHNDLIRATDKAAAEVARSHGLDWLAGDESL